MVWNGLIIDENLTWKNHIEVVENKISNYIGVLYRASHLPDFKNPLKIYFSFIHIYISYANIAWASSFKTKPQGILKKQKHAARITFPANRSDHSRPLLKEMKALNFYQINLIQTLKFMHKTTLICSFFVYLVIRKSMLNIDSSDSLVDKLTLFSDLNDWLVLGDKVCESSTSSNRINLANSLNNNVCIVFL